LLTAEISSAEIRELKKCGVAFAERIKIHGWDDQKFDL